MPLVGTLSTMPVADLLQWLGSAGGTGVVTFERNKVTKRIVFREGHVIACSTSDPSELLGHFLVSRGKITEDTLRAALATQEQSGGHLGAILVGMNALTSAVLTRMLCDKAEETIFGLFDLDDAVFRFENSDISQENVSFPVDLRVEDILLRGMQRIDETREIRTVFNDPGIVLRRSDRSADAEIASNRMARRIYDLVNGERTVAEILLHAHASEYLVTKFLYHLVQNGFAAIKETRDVPGPGPAPVPPVVHEIDADATADELEFALLDDALADAATTVSPSADAIIPLPASIVSAPVATAPPGVSATVAPVAPAAAASTPAQGVCLDSDLEVAGNLMSRGEFDAALEILNGTYKAYPGDEALGRLLAEAEACFLEKAYRHFVPPHKVPVLLRPPDELTQEQISPEEYFLLSRIDGQWDVKSIIQVSPIREVDAVRTLKRMREKGFIKLRDTGGD